MTNKNAFKYQIPLKITPNQYPYSMHSSNLLNICDSVNQKLSFILWFSDLRDYELRGHPRKVHETKRNANLLSVGLSWLTRDAHLH